MTLEWVVGRILASIGWVFGKMQALDVELRELHLRDLSGASSLNDIITAHPIAYLGKLQITNGTDRRRGIKAVQLAVGGRIYPWAEETIAPFDIGDVRTLAVLFPADATAHPTGPFELSLTDSTGRTRRVSGHLTGRKRSQ